MQINAQAISRNTYQFKRRKAERTHIDFQSVELVLVHQQVANSSLHLHVIAGNRITLVIALKINIGTIFVRVCITN
jgi:hypothetical protein